MTESSLVAFKRGPSPERTLDVFGVDVTFLVEGVHTDGRFGMLEYVSKPGHEPPPHWHEPGAPPKPVLLGWERTGSSGPGAPGSPFFWANLGSLHPGCRHVVVT